MLHCQSTGTQLQVGMLVGGEAGVVLLKQLGRDPGTHELGLYSSLYFYYVDDDHDSGSVTAAATEAAGVMRDQRPQKTRVHARMFCFEQNLWVRSWQWQRQPLRTIQLDCDNMCCGCGRWKTLPRAPQRGASRHSCVTQDAMPCQPRFHKG